VKNLTFITGGVRSGKSRLAETLANSSGRQIYYMATMQRISGDHEQDERIDRHRRRRPDTWLTVECPYSLAESIGQLPGDVDACVIIDCLSLFVTNLMLSQEMSENPYACEAFVMNSSDAVLKAISSKNRLHFIVVTNEVGWGVVPESSLGRAFRDFLGMANQRFAAQAETVWLICSGLPVKLKPGLVQPSLLPASPA
jgi:adenosylcobinamide kinase/adenosylcobinamide-phosphate guanylyltransferase